MLIQYKKDYEKTAMGLLSYLPDFKNIENLYDSIEYNFDYVNVFFTKKILNNIIKFKEKVIINNNLIKLKDNIDIKESKKYFFDYNE